MNHQSMATQPPHTANGLESDTIPVNDLQKHADAVGVGPSDFRSIRGSGQVFPMESACFVRLVLPTRFKIIAVDKKADELRWLERFGVYSDLEFELDDPRQEREAPDFLIRFQGRTVGVEIAKLQLDQHGALKKGSALQERLSLQNRIVECARKWYSEEENSPINVRVYFEDISDLQDLGIYRNEMARSLVESLRQLRLEDFERCRLDQYSDPPVCPPISFLDASGLPAGSQPRWQVVDVGWSRAFRPAQVASLLEEKNTRLERYQQVADENWLVIVADRLHSPGMFRPPEEPLLELPVSGFCRTFLLCAPGPHAFLIDWSDGRCYRLPDLV